MFPLEDSDGVAPRIEMLPKGSVGPLFGPRMALSARTPNARVPPTVSAAALLSAPSRSPQSTLTLITKTSTRFQIIGEKSALRTYVESDDCTNGFGEPLGERQVKAYPRTQTDRRTVGKANGGRIFGAFRKTLFGTTFRFV